MNNQPIKVLCHNKQAFHNYVIIDSIEAGLQLTGNEVLNILSGNISLNGSYITVIKNELWLIGCDISFSHKSTYKFNNKPKRNKKLLCHSKEIVKIKQQIELKGLTIIPLMIYRKNGYLKIKIGIAKGKRLVDKREDIKKRDLNYKILHFK